MARPALLMTPYQEILFSFLQMNVQLDLVEKPSRTVRTLLTVSVIIPTMIFPRISLQSFKNIDYKKQ